MATILRSVPMMSFTSSNSALRSSAREKAPSQMEELTEATTSGQRSRASLARH